MVKANDTPLTDDQSSLAAENVKLAYDLVYRRKTKYAPVKIAVEKLGDDRALSEALAALVRAARGFKPGLGFKFSTYAVAVMKRAIVKAGQTCGRLTERWLNGKFAKVPFAAQFGTEESEGADGILEDSIPDERGIEEPPYSPQELEALRLAISNLTERQRVVLIRRFFGGETLDTVGRAIGSSREAARQLQERAIARLRDMLVREEP